MERHSHPQIRQLTVPRDGRADLQEGPPEGHAVGNLTRAADFVKGMECQKRIEVHIMAKIPNYNDYLMIK